MCDELNRVGTNRFDDKRVTDKDYSRIGMSKLYSIVDLRKVNRTILLKYI